MAYFNVDRRFGLHTVNKCASTAIQNTFMKSGYWFSQVDIDQYLKLSHRVVFIRNPYDRIISTYRMYKRNGCSWRHNLESFEAFIDSICKTRLNKQGVLQSDGERDPHTMPIWYHVTKKGFTPNEIIRWDFKRMAELMGVDEIDKENAAHVSQDPVTWENDSFEQYTDWYKNDLHIWNGKLDISPFGTLYDELGLLTMRGGNHGNNPSRA